jgi:preprotein translocase SecE subunit
VNNWIHIIVWAVVIGAVFGYLWWQGQVQRLAVYITETREELRKCAWPNWEELQGSTVLITVMIAILGGFVVVIDMILFKLSSYPLALVVAVLAGLVAWKIIKSQRQ